METLQQDFMNKPVKKVFFHFFFPAVFGMLLMSVNMLIDGIFVGHGVGEVGLAGVNLASPIFTVILAISLWIGIGGATNFSTAVGEGATEKARSSFTLALAILIVLLGVISIVGYFNIQTVATWLGANEETSAPTSAYLRILFSLGWILGLQELLSIFIRNDGRPILGMVSLGITSIVNVILNYIFIFKLGLGVYGAGLATVIAGIVGIAIFIPHFFKKQVVLNKLAWAWSKQLATRILAIGLPSLLAESGSFILVVGYNLSLVATLGTEGVTAFSVINYLHGFMFLAFFGIETAMQPMISYYHGAKKKLRMQITITLAEKTAVGLGLTLFVIGYVFAPSLVRLFGVHDSAIIELAVEGIRLFFISYFFIGISFVYMTYFQSVGKVWSATAIILCRSYALFLVYLFVLPTVLGVNGIWLSMPIAELTMALLIVLVVRKRVRKQLKVKHNRY
ncbi:MATE family efflux transporter [Paenibacillus polymyxa]|uniref:MATE family efflux transporter n=1 Tax=Paenibacillus polymyxa TaxID=1406 RepID=UPI0025B6CACB|nr:MATE family efflux transporter [Paenibacillus polymyxa]MDN4081244.1 MATE family efflux transporter [Paenibacillus polymyxa]MDN4106947.1 MATE family efflux transporter [Paenibacillus polymyxa]MDN4116884.1 MATE family efflux transporter [Paenibacillus polymyxa]MEB4780887.1 MATE family efflux transporter [Paenibacillus jamilae]